ncbi:NAD-dependent epimerase/dehydratase family protein [Sphingomonas sp. MMS24-J45]|uniref:NAD-dependent epimerase/dehydratase family protein n=1 Tax=Sphingomonas sp. MMS24-J45 TaxID=3238806 RepID=UPI00384B385C
MTAPQTVLLTGGSGFIGAHLARHLYAAGYRVEAPPRATLDLEDPAAVARFVDTCGPDVVINLASPAMAYVRASTAAEAEDAKQRELRVALALTAAVRPGTRFVQAGSMAEYGYSGRHAEDAPCRPVSVYGRAKLAASLAVLEACAASGIDATVARIFGAYGPGENERRLFPQILAARYHDRPIDLSDGSQLRDFIHVDDVCTAIVRLIALPMPLQPVYNVGTGHAVSVRMAVERIAREAEITASRLHFGAMPRSVVDEEKLEADITNLLAALDWSPPQRFMATAPLLPSLDPEAASPETGPST